MPSNRSDKVSAVLRIHVLGRPYIEVGGARSRFPTQQAELLVYSLALAGPDGLHKEELGERLWPGAPLERIAPRLRTAIYNARRGLGEKAWRLGRDADMVVLDLYGAYLDYDRAVAAAEAAVRDGGGAALEDALGALSRPLLAKWPYEQWVIEAERDKQALVASLRRRSDLLFRETGQ